MTKLLTKIEVAELFQVSLRTIDNWIETRKVPYIKLGKSVRFRQNELEHYLSRKSVKAKT